MRHNVFSVKWSFLRIGQWQPG